MRSDNETTGLSQMTMQQNRREYNATVTHGEARTLQGDGSDVSLDIPEGSQGVYMTRVHTDHTDFKDVIPEEECFIGPPVEVEHLSDGDKDNNIHVLHIPHCITDEDIWKQGLYKLIKVRRGNKFKNQHLEEVPMWTVAQGRSTYFEVKSSHIVIYTSGFSFFTCSICKKVCAASARIYLYGNLSQSTEERMTIVKVKPYICSSLYKIEDYRKVRTNFILKLALYLMMHHMLYYIKTFITCLLVPVGHLCDLQVCFQK